MQAVPQDSTAARIIARLETMPGLKIRDHGDYLKMNSPLRAKSDSQDFKLTIRDGEHGAYHDGPANAGGSLYQLAEKLGVEAAQKPQDAPNSKRSYTGLADYAHAHGTAREAYELAGWSEDTYSGRPALVIPTENGPRWRFLDGQKPAYLNPTGYAPCWYGLKRAVDMATRRGGPLFLCNGEASVVAAQYHGVAAAAITTGAERVLPDNLLADLREMWDGPITVALDCDQKGRDAAPKLAAQLKTSGYSATAVDLGGSGGFDLADFCKLYEAESYAVLCELATARPKAETEKPRRKWLADDEIDLLAPPEFLISGIIPDKAITVVYGPPDAGKTFIVVDIALRVSQLMPVMYVAGEDGAGIKVRRTAWRQFYGKPANRNFMMWNEPINLMDSADVDEFIEQTRPTGARLVVFDTLRQCAIGADEKEAKDMSIFFRACDRIVREVGCAVIVLHHSTKSGNSWSGSGAIKGNSYAMLKVERDDDDIVFECDRIKNTPGFERRVYRLVNVADTDTCVIQPAVRSVQPTDNLSNNQRKVLEAIAHMYAATSKAPLTTEALRYTQLEGNNFYKPFRRLRERGYIEQGEKAGWIPTLKGRDYLNTEYAEQRPRASDMGGEPIDVFEVNAT